MGRRRMMGVGKATVFFKQTFTNNTNWIVPRGCKKVDVFLCGGGGSGSYSGGGGGYTKTYFDVPVTPGEIISIKIGAGGEGGSMQNARNNGDFSQFKNGNYQAKGGECPPYFTSIGQRGGSGGSGGGSYSEGINNPANGGSDGSNGAGVNPGIGQGSTTREFGESNGTLYGGGGGGSRYGIGADGAGSGIYPGSGDFFGTSAKPNTGGGGGGGTHGGANGGSGIVIVRGYKYE